MTGRFIRGTVGAAAFVLAAMSLAQPASATALGSRWRGTTLAADECLQRAATMLREGGFSDVTAGNDVAYGHRDRDGLVAQLMCPTGHNLVVFIFTSPDPKQIESILNDFYGRF